MTSHQPTKNTLSLKNNSKRNTHSFQKKHIIALNRLAAIANLPGTQELSPTSIAQIIQERNPKQSILLQLLQDEQLLLHRSPRHTLTHRFSKRCPQISQKPKPNTLCPSTQHPHHSHAQQHTRHSITNNLIRGPPPTNTDPSTSNGHPNQSSVFDTPNIPCLLT